MKEKFISHKGFEVGDLGNIKGRKLTKSPNGYKMFHAKGRTHYVHRLVAEAHVENPGGHQHVRFHDDDRGNTRATNLYWARNRSRGPKDALGLVRARRVRDLAKRGVPHVEIGRRENITPSAVSLIVGGRRWAE